jgi:hypothetical protein
MIVSSVGGASSLPMSLGGYQTVTGHAAEAGARAAATADGTASAGTDEVRLPGQSRKQAMESAAETKKKEESKPAPLPPLKGLTVAEIRAMLGVAPLPGQDAASGLTSSTMAALTTTQSVATAFLRQNQFSRYQFA